MTNPVVTGVSTTTPNYLGPLTVLGTGFLATQGGGSVLFGGVTQTVSTWSDTSITINSLARGSSKFGVAEPIVVTTSAALSSGAANFVTALLPPPGWDFINLTTPDAVHGITVLGTLASGNQVAYDTRGSQVQVFSDTTFVHGTNVIPFNCEAWTLAGGWVSSGAQSVLAPPIVYNQTRIAAMVAATYGSLAPAITYGARILPAPVVGKPLTYVVDGLPAGVTVTSQQWYLIKTAGPVLTPGATGLTYTPVTADIAGFPVVRGTTSDGGTFKCFEWPSAPKVVTQTAVFTPADPNAGTIYEAASEAVGISAKTAVTARVIADTGTGKPKYCIDSAVAPGFYSGSATLGDLTAYQPSVFFTGMRRGAALSCAPVIAPDLDSTPATFPRPAASTGVGFYVANGRLYDANGKKFTIRGIDRNHWDSGSPGAGAVGLFNSGSSAMRIFMDPTNPGPGGITNTALMNDMVANKVVPIPCSGGSRCLFTGTVSGNTLTVTAITAGVIGWVPGQGSVTGTGLTARQITAQTSNSDPAGAAGKTGTYTLSGAAITISTPTAMVYTGISTTGNGSLTNGVLAAVAQTWADQFSIFHPFERYMILNIANEWGPTGSATNTVWRDEYIKAVQVIRAAGYKCPIMIDAPGNGQDGATGGVGWTLLNHGPAVLASDPQANIIFSLHIYANGKPGAFSTLIASLMAASGMTFVIGEFGPEFVIVPGNPTSLQPLELIAVCEAKNIGWMAWAWDDPPNETREVAGYALCKQAGSNGYATNDPAQLTVFGRQIVLDPVYGLKAIATRATVFP